MSELIPLFAGYSRNIDQQTMEANCSCTLIKGPVNCIIDTMTAWDGPLIIDALKEQQITPADINYVICSHGHSDHIGCNYLFENATHIVGFSISKKDRYDLSVDFGAGQEYVINDEIRVIPTPGHTLQDVSVIFKKNGRVFAVTGDLFERKEDLENERLWMSVGSDNVELQRQNRKKILSMAHYIIPGHGPMFEVNKKYKTIGDF